jgi:TP901 family phage tail tape measure protein
MNLSEQGLNKLGDSAVQLAKDLSMSMENSMKIYQIYANMQTSISEIEQTAKPTAILSNLSGVDTSTASDQVQGILQQFNMLNDGTEDVAATSMHVVDVLDKISANVAIDYAKGIGIITDAVTAAGAVSYDAGLSFEQLAAISAKVAERTREDGGSIGNAIKTIVTRISKVGKMPAYADEVSNEELSKASESLNEIGIAVYNADGSFRDLDVILTELRDKWDGLTDAQKSNISFQIAATRQTSKFKNILESWTDAMNLANEASLTSGNAEANQEKYEESYNGKMQKIATQWDAFWLNVMDSPAMEGILNFFIKLTGGIDNLSESLGGGTTALMLFLNLFAIKGKLLKKGALSQPKSWLQTYIIIIKWAYYHKEYYIMA